MFQCINNITEMKCVFNFSLLIILLFTACESKDSVITHQKIQHWNWNDNEVILETNERHKLIVPYHIVANYNIKGHSRFLSSISKLTVDLNNKADFYANFYFLKNLEYLETKNINTDSVDIDYCRFERLSTLVIDMKAGISLFRNHCKSNSIFIVRISGCRTLKSIESGLNDFPKLTFLTIGGAPNRCKYNFSFATFDHLEYLEMYTCELTSIPGDIASSRSITHLDFSNNNIDNLPMELQNMKQLYAINLRSNNFSKMPAVLQLPNITFHYLIILNEKKEKL